jgi:hypothetical protein
MEYLLLAVVALVVLGGKQPWQQPAVPGNGRAPPINPPNTVRQAGAGAPTIAQGIGLSAGAAASGIINSAGGAVARWIDSLRSTPPSGGALDDWMGGDDSLLPAPGLDYSALNFD